MIEQLATLVAGGDVVALSGAGMSTDSGIPDYRGPTGTQRRHPPMTYREFVSDHEARRRYWARSQLGWRHVTRARPNPSHGALATLERRGWVSGLITQNVDGLHPVAGSRNVVELHGNLARTLCLDCGDARPRQRLAERLDALNPGFAPRPARMAPDGDADLHATAERTFVVAACTVCGGVLKPDVVFFGERVPRARVERSFAMLEAASALLVVGSSLTVMSGYRFVIRARKRGTPVAIVNRGPTRGDADAVVRIDAGLADVLPRLVDLLADRAPTRAPAPPSSLEAVERSRS
ncbi:MAG: NAD-dependent protein deacetylase [Actinobacteria bacterium]|nr:NAD-dependent protein deacetylase [Actinomycetota bacterium]